MMGRLSTVVTQEEMFMTRSCSREFCAAHYKTFSKNKKEHSPLFGVAFVSVFRQTSKFMVLVFLEARGKPFSSRKLLVKFSK